MTVYELIEELKLYPMDMEVFVPDSKKYDENKVYIKSLMDFVIGCILLVLYNYLLWYVC